MAREIADVNLDGVFATLLPHDMDLDESDDFLDACGIEPVDLNTFRAYHAQKLAEAEVGKKPLYCTGDYARTADEDGEIEFMGVHSPNDQHVNEFFTTSEELLGGGHILVRVITKKKPAGPTSKK